MIDFANSPLRAKTLYGGADAHFKGFFSTLQGRVLKKVAQGSKKWRKAHKTGRTRSLPPPLQRALCFETLFSRRARDARCGVDRGLTAEILPRG